MGPQGVGLEDSQTGGLYRGHRTAGGLQDRSKSPLILCTKSDIRVQLSDEDDPHQILKSGPKYLPWFLLQAFFNEYTHTRASNSACPTDPTLGSYCHHGYPRWQHSVVFAIFFLLETPSHNSSPSTFSNRKSRRSQLHFVNLPEAKASKSSRAIYTHPLSLQWQPGAMWRDRGTTRWEKLGSPSGPQWSLGSQPTSLEGKA